MVVLQSTWFGLRIRANKGLIEETKFYKIESPISDGYIQIPCQTVTFRMKFHLIRHIGQYDAEMRSETVSLWPLDSAITRRNGRKVARITGRCWSHRAKMQVGIAIQKRLSSSNAREGRSWSLYWLVVEWVGGEPYYDFVDESSCCFQYSTLSHFAWDSSCDDTWTIQAAQGATSDKERRL